MHHLSMRTTSVLEAMHSVIQRTFPIHPHIFKFIENLRLHEAKKATDLYHLSEKDAKIQQIRAEDRERAEKLRKCTEDLENGLISVENFLDLMSQTKSNPPKKKLNSSTGELKLKSILPA